MVVTNDYMGLAYKDNHGRLSFNVYFNTNLGCKHIN